jgi:hypothetical protein
MINQSPELIRFNKRLDELVDNVMKQQVASENFRREYVKATNLYRRIASYDVELAQDVFVSTLMFAYTFAVGVTDKIYAKGKVA